VNLALSISKTELMQIVGVIIIAAGLMILIMGSRRITFRFLGGAILFLILGQPLEFALLVPVAAGSLLSVPFSAQIIRIAPENLVKRVIGVFTLVMGLLTLVPRLQSSTTDVTVVLPQLCAGCRMNVVPAP